MSDVMSARETSGDLGNTPVGHAAQLRERMRAVIHAEVGRLNPTDDARRALELIIESSLRPSEADGDLQLTVIDGNGEPRLMEKNGETVPFTLQDLLAELRDLHPVLFKSPPEPQPAPDEGPSTPARAAVPQPEPELRRDWLKLDAGEREPEGRPASPPGAQALGHWHKGKVRFHAWSRRMSDRLRTSRWLAGTGQVADLRKGLSDSLADSRERAQAFFDTMQEKPLSRRPGFALGVVAAALLALGLGTFVLLRPSDTLEAGTDGPSETGSLAANPSPAGPAPAAPSSGRALRGVPDVIDTATLSLQGEVVRLFGVEWAPGGGKPDDLAGYLQGREVTCEPAGGNDTYRCSVGGQDLSRVVLYNGGGQPTAQATPELRAAADRAREAKIGVWGKQP